MKLLLFLIISFMPALLLHSMKNQLLDSIKCSSSGKQEQSVLYRHCTTFKSSHTTVDQDPVIDIEFFLESQKIRVTNSIEMETFCLISGKWICACNPPQHKKPRLIDNIINNGVCAFVYKNNILITENNITIRKKIDIPEGSKVSTMAFSPNNNQLIVGFESGLIGVFDNENYYQILEGHHTNITKIVFSPNGRGFATGDRLGNVIYWI